MEYKNNKILILGSTGLLGSYLSRSLNLSNSHIIEHSSGRSESLATFDLMNKGVLEWLKAIDPDVVINCVALTDVDRCEKDYGLAFKLNTLVPQMLEKYSELNKLVRIIHISSDQVYSGVGPHIEESADPANIYGWSKFLGEQQLDPNRHLIIRTNFVGKSMIPCKKKSFSDWIIENFYERNRINLYTDIQFNPVHMCDIANLICHVLTKKWLAGIYNFGGGYSVSKADFAIQLSKRLNIYSNIYNLSYSSMISERANRPHDMRINSSRLEKCLSLKVPTMNEVLEMIKSEYII